MMTDLVFYDYTWVGGGCYISDVRASGQLVTLSALDVCVSVM